MNASRPGLAVACQATGRPGATGRRADPPCRSVERRHRGRDGLQATAGGADAMAGHHHHRRGDRASPRSSCAGRSCRRRGPAARPRLVLTLRQPASRPRSRSTSSPTITIATMRAAQPLSRNERSFGSTGGGRRVGGDLDLARLTQRPRGGARLRRRRAPAGPGAGRRSAQRRGSAAIRGPVAAGRDAGVPGGRMRLVVRDAPRAVDERICHASLTRRMRSAPPRRVQVGVEALRQAPVGARHLQRRRRRAQRPGPRTDRGPGGWASGRFYGVGPSV